MKAANHDKSFNEGLLDDHSRMILNQSELLENQHHNQSIGAIGNTRAKQRVSSQERGGRIQRPRSSKGFRGNMGDGSHNNSIGPGFASGQTTAAKFHSTKSEER